VSGPNANLADGSELVTIPVGNDLPWYYFAIGLAGVQYTLRFRFNTRMSRWVMDIADAENNDLLTSLPLLIGRNLAGQYSSIPNLPAGTFFVVDETGQNSQPTRYSFGTTHTLYYLDPTATT
jgi:hypothetical protein